MNNAATAPIAARLTELSTGARGTKGLASRAERPYPLGVDRRRLKP